MNISSFATFPAESPDDYLAVNGTLHFKAGDTEQCYHVQIVDYAFCDPGQFCVLLSTVPTLFAPLSLPSASAYQPLVS